MFKDSYLSVDLTTVKNLNYVPFILIWALTKDSYLHLSLDINVFSTSIAKRII